MHHQGGGGGGGDADPSTPGKKPVNFVISTLDVPSRGSSAPSLAGPVRWVGGGGNNDRGGWGPGQRPREVEEPMGGGAGSVDSSQEKRNETANNFGRQCRESLFPHDP